MGSIKVMKIKVDILKNKYLVYTIVLAVLLVISIIYCSRISSELERYKEYHTNKIGNLMRPIASDVMECKEILTQIVENKKIDQNQLEMLISNQSIFKMSIYELEDFANQVIDDEQEYDIPQDYIDFDWFLYDFEYTSQITSGKYDPSKLKEKVLSSEELEKFVIMKQVMSDYSEIFVNGLSDYKNGEFDNRGGFYDDEYDVDSEEWILVLMKIFQYNRDSEYKDQF